MTLFVALYILNAVLYSVFKNENECQCVLCNLSCSLTCFVCVLGSDSPETLRIDSERCFISAYTMILLNLYSLIKQVVLTVLGVIMIVGMKIFRTKSQHTFLFPLNSLEVLRQHLSAVFPRAFAHMLWL